MPSSRSTGKHGSCRRRHQQQQNQHNKESQMQQQKLEFQQSEILFTDEDQVETSSVLLTMASLLFSAYFLASGAVQITFGVLNWSICDIQFSKSQPTRESWLTASCFVIGCLRFLQFVPYARPSFDPRLYAPPERHPQIARMLRPLEYMTDVGSDSQDIGVIGKAQICAGIINPGFYYRTVVVAWLEGLIFMLGLAQHATRMYVISTIFTEERHTNLLMLDAKLIKLFSHLGSKAQGLYSLRNIANILEIRNASHAIELVSSQQFMYRFAHHNCRLFSSYMATVFWYEDCSFVCLIAVLLMIPAIMSCFTFQILGRFINRHDYE